MRIFLRYILRSMLEKKSRLVLLLIAIALSSGTLIGSLGMVNVAVEVLGKSQLEAIEHKEISITSQKGSESFKISHIQPDGIQQLVPQILKYITYGEDNEKIISIYGRENIYINQDLILGDKSLENFSGKECIISMRTSEIYGWQTGDTIEVELKNKIVKLHIYAVAKNEGLFYSDNENTFTMIVPYEFMANTYSMRGKYNYVTANKKEATIEASVDAFNVANRKFKASQIYNDSNTYVDQLSMPLYMMLIIMVLMSSVIIYSSFKLIITERLGTIGTFLSQGATKETIRHILYLESMSYGIVGGLIGCGIGIGIIKVTAYAMSPLKAYGIIETVEIPIYYYPLSLGFAIVLALVSAMIPILSVNKLQVKELILNVASSSGVIGLKRPIIGTVLLGITFGMSQLSSEWVTYMSPLLLIGAVTAVILIFPCILAYIAKVIFERIKAHFPILGMALNNVSTSKVLVNNMTLMFMAMFVVVMINSVGSSLEYVVGEAYSTLNYDIELRMTGGKYGTDAEGIRRLIKKDKDITLSREEYDFEAAINDNLVYVQGIEEDKYLEYNQYLHFDESYAVFEKGDKRSAIIAEKVATQNNLKVGDTFNLTINDQDETFHVTSIVDGKLYYNGIVVLIKKAAMTDLYDIKYPTNINIETKADAASVKERLQSEMSKRGAMLYTFDETKQDNIDSNNQIFVILNLFSIMAIMISALGILNNIGISFIQRKKSIVVLSSVGMTSEQRGGMLLVESVLTTLCPSIVLCVFGPWSMQLMERLIGFMMGLEMPITFSISLMPKILLMALAMVLLATVPIINKNKKFKIVEELKFE